MYAMKVLDKAMLTDQRKLKQIENLVIVSDTDMPLMDGDRACKKLLEEFPEIYQKRIINTTNLQIDFSNQHGIFLLAIKSNDNQLQVKKILIN